MALDLPIELTWMVNPLVPDGHSLVTELGVVWAAAGLRPVLSVEVVRRPSPTCTTGAGVVWSLESPRPMSTPMSNIPPRSAIPITAASGETSAGRPCCCWGWAAGSAAGGEIGTRGSPRRVPQARQ